MLPQLLAISPALSAADAAAVDAVVDRLQDALAYSPLMLDITEARAAFGKVYPELSRTDAVWSAAISRLVQTGPVTPLSRIRGTGVEITPLGGKVGLLQAKGDPGWAWARAARALGTDPRSARLAAALVMTEAAAVPFWMYSTAPELARGGLITAILRAGLVGDTSRISGWISALGVELGVDDRELLAVLRVVPPDGRRSLFSALHLDPLRYPWYTETKALRQAWAVPDDSFAVDELLTARVFAGELTLSELPPRSGAAVWAALLTAGQQAGEERAAALAQAMGLRVNSTGMLPESGALAIVLALGLSADPKRRALARRLAMERGAERLRRLVQSPRRGGGLRLDVERIPAGRECLPNIVNAREGEPLEPPGRISHDLLAELLQALAVHFAGLPADAARLHTLIELADDMELPRLAVELRALRGDLEGGRGATLLKLWTPEARWTLALRRMSSQLGLKVGAETRGRVRWTLDLPALMAGQPEALIPRIQSLDKAGRLSAGRQVKVQAILRGTVAEAIRQDVSVAEALANWTMGPPAMVVSPAHVMRALAGHPNVIDPLGRPLVIRERRAGLRLRRAGDGLLVQSFAPSASDAVRVVSPGLVEVVSADDATLDLLSVVGEELLVPQEGVEAFLTLIPALRERVQIDDHAGVLDGAAVAEPLAGETRPVLQLRPAKGGAAVRVCVRPAGAVGPALAPGDGPDELMLRVEDVLQPVLRDRAEELRRLDELRALIPALDGLEPGQERDLPDPWAALELLEAVAAVGHRAGVEWPEGKPLRIRARVGLRDLKLRWGAGSGDWLSAEGGLSLPTGENIDLESLLAALRSGSRGFVPLGEGAFLALSAELKQQLERLDRARRLGAAAEGVQVHALAMGALRGLLENSVLTPEADARLARLQAAAEAPINLPAALAARLRPYQMDGLRWMARLCTLGVGALLADDMGLGKTLQSLALLSARAAEGPALVLAPASVVGGWVDQAAAFTPWLKVHRLDDLAKGALKVGPGQVVVCSYGLLPHHGERLAGVGWATLVIDEAQAIKNADTQRHQLVTTLRAEARLALSGTPVENHLTELWSLSEVLNPGLLGPADGFRRRFAEPIAEGDDEARDQLRGLLLPLVLRRTKGEVLPDLPPRIDITVPVQLSPEEAIAYERLRVAAVDEIAAQGADPMRVLVALTRLRQAACHPSLVDPGLAGLPSAKLDALGELLDHLVENDHRALIFSQFTAHLDRAQALLEARGLAWHRLDGAVPARERDRRVKAFQAGEGRAFLISLRAGGAGLNLTGADHVVHLDPWWNPAVEDQASDRAHRIGQTRPVTIYRLIAQGTIEDKILRMHAEKRALADQLLAGADGAASLGVSELVALISEGSLSSPAPKRRKR
jgi:hypothetical protein